MKKTILLVAVLFTFLVSCSKDEPLIQNSLSIQITPSESGTVLPSSNTYNENETVSLLATPLAGFVFKNWQGDVTGTTNPITITMNKNKSITCIFEELDSDGDGVTDNNDTCSDTPSGQTVDTNGCSDSQKDTDGDGVLDSVDNCPDTPSGQTVDTNGCSDSQKTYVPDNNFEQRLIDLGYDNILDDYVITHNILPITGLVLNGLNIKNLTGIEDFKNLHQLWCNDNQLTNIDVSKNTLLTSLTCNNNNLTSIDVSGNEYLTGLEVSKNELMSLDVSKNKALTWLICDSNQLTSLDVSNNTSLESLMCENNQLTGLNVSNNTALILLRCSINKLTSLDVSKNTALTWLMCISNQLTSLDVSNNTSLTNLFSSDNQLTSIDVSNIIDLTYFSSFDNQISCIKVNQGQLNNIPTTWQKDIDSIYSLNCN